jgi:diacylglycerol kinase (ATP)
MYRRMQERFGFIVNRSAGNGRGAREWPAVESVIMAANLNYEVGFTSAKGDAVRIAGEFVQKGYNRLISVGGDGTLNEVVNGIFRVKNLNTEDLILGAIPVGKGNDWCRTFQIPFDTLGALHLILGRKGIMKQDIGKIEQSVNGISHIHYFANVAGGGFDGFVAKKVNKLKEKGAGSPLIYLWVLMTSVFKYKSGIVRFRSTSFSYEEDVLSFSVGIGKYNGGGMNQLPNAVPNDGLFDITIIRRMSVLEVIANVKKLFDGSILLHPKVDVFLEKELWVEADRHTDLESDGENLNGLPAKFTILPRSINIFTGL